MKHLETVLESGILSGISKAECIAAFESFGVTSEDYKKDEIIFSAGDTINSICIVKKGCVREEKGYQDGEVCILHTYRENSIFALEATVSRKQTIGAEYISNEDCTVVYIPYKNVIKSKWAKEIMEMLLQILADDNFRNIKKIEILARRGLRERILLYLNHLKKKTGSNVVDVKMDREQMAQFLCVSRSGLSNELNKLKREGCIDFTKNKFILREDIE